MAEHKSVYLWSLQEAQKLNEVDLWRESYKENCTCARAIEQCIDENYADNRLNTDAAKGIIDRFGFNRVNWVLANTIQRKDFDGRISQANKEWAKGFYIPNDDIRWHYEVSSHPGLTDLFANRVRQEWQSLGLFDRSHCSEEADYEGKLLALKPSTLKDEYKSVTIGNHFAVHGFKIYDGDDGKGPRVMYPATKGNDGKYYEDFHPVTKEAREAINGYILDAYEQKLEQTQGEDQSAGEDLDDDEEPAFEQTM